MTKKTYEPTTTRQTLNRVRAESMPFDWSINPYRGCAHGCSFCYARAFQSFIGKGADDEFQNHILMKMNAAEALESQLSRIARKHKGDPAAVARQVGVVAIGTATDPYQPVEAKEQLTRQCLEVLARYRIPTSITTRSPLILRDLDLLTRVPIMSINISMNTLDAVIVRKLEPASPLPVQRLEAVEALARAGLNVGVFAAPVLPCLTDSSADLDALFSAVKARQAAFVMTSLLRLSPDVKTWYMQCLQEHFPKLVPAYRKLYEGTYANKSYIDSFKTLVNQLLEKHGLSGDIPRKADATKCPSASLAESELSPYPGSTPRPEAEQLSFSL